MKKQILMNYTFVLILFGMLSVISIYCAATYTSTSLGILSLKQLSWYIVGGIAIYFLVKLGISRIYDFSWVLYFFFVGMLVLLLLFGEPINGSKCWLFIPGIGSFQPSEFMKIILVLVLANLICKFKNGNDNSMKGEFLFIVKCLSVVMLPAVLTFLQPDTGAVLIYGIIFVTMMFASGIKLRWFLFALLCLVFIFGICGGIYFLDEDLFVRLFGTSLYYRIERIFMWSDGVGLQLENSLAAIGSASWFGHGFNKTPIYFPESSTDFIFSVFASNFGFVGSIALLIFLLSFDLYILNLISKKNHSISYYVLVGFFGMLLFQQIQNIGMTIGLFPIMGITLPFISYGGSSLLSYMIIYALIISISFERKKAFYK